MHTAGTLTCIGLGITLGSQLTELAKNQLATADVVFFHSNTHYLESFLRSINPELVDLQLFYQRGSSRLDSYESMITAIITAVTQGKNVVWACYGHPGVASWPPHETIRRLKAAGYHAKMEAGIAADACLYADLGIDPVADGCQQFEASQFLFYHRTIDTAACLILWQVSIAGDFTLTKLDSQAHYIEILAGYLQNWYPAHHKVILYEAADLPIWQPRADKIALKELPMAPLNQITTLVIPPLHPRVPNTDIMDKLGVPADHPLRHK